MNRLVMLSLVAAMTLAIVPSPGQACSCVSPELPRSYNNADDVVIADVIGELGFIAPAGYRWYVGIIETTFKGCLGENEWIIIQTRNSSAACGAYLQQKKYLLHGYSSSSLWGIPLTNISLCDYNVEVSQITTKDKDFLGSRYSCCDDSCGCNDGTEPVNCLLDPCMFAECGDPIAVCHSNYCGGCNAEWYDEFGGVADCTMPEEASCDPREEKSCNDEDLVCMADDMEEEGICKPFEHGASVGAGYACGGSIGVSCAKGLFCKGLPYGGGIIGGSGVCTLMNCDDWFEEYRRLVDANNHCETAQDCVAVKGTSCGCTRDLVLSAGANMDAFWDLAGLMQEDGCNPFISTCDCPPVDGFKCEHGHCAWNYGNSLLE